MRKYFAFLAFLFLHFSAFADSVKVGDFEVEEYGTGAYLDVTITVYSGPGGELAMQIPGRPITIIGQEVFAGKEITTVELPATLTEIREGAFRNNLLEKLEFPQTLAVIGEGAFAGNDLKEIVLPPYMETIGDRAFAGSRITRISIDAEVNIGPDAFDHKFAAYYLSSGKNAGTYVYRLGRWYTETEWLAISAMDDDPIDRGPENIEPRADIPPTINFGLSGVETVTVMDFEVVGQVSVSRQEVIEFGPLGIQKNRSGSRITWFDLMMEASRMGADDVVNIHIDAKLEETRMLFDFASGYRVARTYTATGVAVKYTGTIEQLKSERQRDLEGRDIRHGAQVERFRRNRLEKETPPYTLSDTPDTPYPLFSVGGYTTYNDRSGESSVTGAIGGVETRLSENFFLGLEGGVYPFYYEDDVISKTVHGFRIADIYAGFSFDVGFLSLEGLAGLYLRNADKNFGPQDRAGFGYIVGANAGFRFGPHYLFGAFRYAEEVNTDDESLNALSMGVGYKYTYIPMLNDYYEEEYRKNLVADIAGTPPETIYPLFSAGGYFAYNLNEGENRSGDANRSGFMGGVEIRFSENFFLGLESGGFPFTYNEGAGTQRESFFTTDLYAGLSFNMGILGLEALGGLYFRNEAAGPQGRGGFGYIAGANAGFRLGPHYVFGAFRYADELNEFEGEEPVRGMNVGAGYKYTYIPRPPDYEKEYEETLARQRQRETLDAEDFADDSIYPLLKIGGYGMFSSSKDEDGYRDAGLMAMLEARFADEAPFIGIEAGWVPFSYDNANTGFRENEPLPMFMGYIGLPVQASGSSFALELLLGVFQRHEADDEYAPESPGMGRMLGFNAGFHSGPAYLFGTYRMFKDNNLSTSILGLGLKQALLSRENEETLSDDLRRRRELPDPDEENIYPLFGAGAWYGVSALGGEGGVHNVWNLSGEARFSESFGLVMEAGTLRLYYETEGMFGWDDDHRENFNVISLLGEYILQPVDAFELNFLAGFYYGGHNSGGDLISKGLGFESGVNAGIRLGRHYI
jgi:hypothetical protein